MPKVVVFFNAMRDGSGRELRAEAGNGVQGVLIGDEARNRFTQKHGLQAQPGGRTFPDGVKLFSEDTELMPPMLEEGEKGPEDVCYWVDGRLICWD